MTTAVIISNESIKTHNFESGVNHTDIHDIVGGWFDAVRTDTLIGYVHDTGLIDGQHINYVATALFGRILCGTCVVFGAMNENGEYDGDDHDVPMDDIARIAFHADTYQLWLNALAEKRTATRTGNANDGLV